MIVQARPGREAFEGESPGLLKQNTMNSQDNQDFADISFERKFSGIKKVEEKLVDISGLERCFSDPNAESNQNKETEPLLKADTLDLTPKKQNSNVIEGNHSSGPLPEKQETETRADTLTKSTSTLTRERQSSFPHDEQPRRRFLKPRKRTTYTSAQNDYEIFGAFCSTSLPNKLV